MSPLHVGFTEKDCNACACLTLELTPSVLLFVYNFNIYQISISETLPTHPFLEGFL